MTPTHALQSNNGLETIVENKQMNGFVYEAKLNSTLLNEDAFALSRYCQKQPHHFSTWCILFI